MGDTSVQQADNMPGVEVCLYSTQPDAEAISSRLQQRGVSAIVVRDPAQVAWVEEAYRPLWVMDEQLLAASNPDLVGFILRGALSRQEGWRLVLESDAVMYIPFGEDIRLCTARIEAVLRRYKGYRQGRPTSRHPNRDPKEGER